MRRTERRSAGCKLKFVSGVRDRMRFAGHEFSVPSNPHVYLESLYGDYMTPPPPQARQTHIRELKFLSEG